MRSATSTPRRRDHLQVRKAFVRLGYQHYDYGYTYSGMWLGTPNKIDDIQGDPLMAQLYAPIESMDH